MRTHLLQGFMGRKFTIHALLAVSNVKKNTELWVLHRGTTFAESLLSEMTIGYDHDVCFQSQDTETM